MTSFQSEWREPQTYLFLSVTNDYFDNFPVCLEGAPDLSISFFNWSSPRTEMLYLGPPTNRNALPGTRPRTEMLYLGPPHEQKCFTWDSPTNRNALPGTPTRAEMLYLEQHHEQKCFNWDSPRTEMLYQAAKKPQKNQKT